MTDKTFNENILVSNIPDTWKDNFGGTYLSFLNSALPGIPSQVVNLISLSSKSREEFLESLSKIAEMDIVSTIIDIFIDDCISASEDDSIFSIEYEPSLEEDREVLDPSVKEEYDSILNQMKDRLNLDRFIKTNAHDLLLYGEFPYSKVVVPGKGIMEIREDLSVKDVIALYDGTKLSKFYVVKNGSVGILTPEEAGHFILNPNVIKMTSKSEDSSYLALRVLMGRSIIGTAIEQIKRLRTNNIVDLVGDLKKILRPDLVQVQVPANMNPNDAVDLVRKYERDLRSPLEALGKETDNLTLEDIVSLTAQIRVVPVWADGKGTLNSIADLNADDNTSQQDEKKASIKRDIALSVGLMPYYLTGDSTPDGDKVSSLKLYSRYSKKCNSIQDCLKEGIRDLGVHEFELVKGFKISRSSIKITFKSVVNTDLLDNIEFVSGSTQVSNDILSLITEVTQSGMGINVKKEVLTDVLNKIMKPITVENLFEPSDSLEGTGEEGESPDSSVAGDLYNSGKEFDNLGDMDFEPNTPEPTQTPEEPTEEPTGPNEEPGGSNEEPEA